jgi:CDP-archaeol synthase
MLLAKLLFVVVITNGAPIIAENVLHAKWNTPVDFGLRLWDRQPLFGHSKTIRGIVAAVLAAIATTKLVGLSALVGISIGVGAMAGDLLSSFLKRRIGVPPSGMALGLDQIPEVLFPLLLVRSALDLKTSDILVLTVLFLLFELAISRVLFRLRIRNRPY